MPKEDKIKKLFYTKLAVKVTKGQICHCTILTMSLGVPYSGKFWREKTLANCKLNCIWRRKLWRIQAQPLAFSDITSNWRIKLWRIRSKSPNSPKFSPAKIFRCTVSFAWKVHTCIKSLHKTLFSPLPLYYICIMQFNLYIEEDAVNICTVNFLL